MTAGKNVGIGLMTTEHAEILMEDREKMRGILTEEEFSSLTVFNVAVVLALKKAFLKAVGVHKEFPEEMKELRVAVKKNRKTELEVAESFLEEKSVHSFQHSVDFDFGHVAGVVAVERERDE